VDQITKLWGLHRILPYPNGIDSAQTSPQIILLPCKLQMSNQRSSRTKKSSLSSDVEKKNDNQEVSSQLNDNPVGADGTLAVEIDSSSSWSGVKRLRTSVATTFPDTDREDQDAGKMSSTQERVASAAYVPTSTEGDDDTLADLTPQQLASLTRSERKRYREKKRRTEVNKGFDDLLNLLVEIDNRTTVEPDERTRHATTRNVDSTGNETPRNRGLSVDSSIAAPLALAPANDDALVSRVDLISRAISKLRQLHTENEQRKLIIHELTRTLDSQEKSSAASHDVSTAGGNPGILPSLWAAATPAATLSGFPVGGKNVSVISFC
jgi:hypothetical protein